MLKISIPKPLEFNWDLHNVEKNWNKHNIDYKECEQAFINKPHLIYEDIKHSQVELRYTLFGFADSYRLIVINYTIRSNQIRVISARDQNIKERRFYAKNKKSPQI
jgi:hypothetical protein